MPVIATGRVQIPAVFDVEACNKDTLVNTEFIVCKFSNLSSDISYTPFGKRSRLFD
jgi:hypothetical protein